MGENLGPAKGREITEIEALIGNKIRQFYPLTMIIVHKLFIYGLRTFRCKKGQKHSLSKKGIWLSLW